MQWCRAGGATHQGVSEEEVVSRRSHSPRRPFSLQLSRSTLIELFPSSWKGSKRERSLKRGTKRGRKKGLGMGRRQLDEGPFEQRSLASRSMIDAKILATARYLDKVTCSGVKIL